MILVVILTVIVVGWAFHTERFYFMMGVMVLGLLFCAIFPHQDTSMDYSGIQKVQTNWTISCYKAVGGFWHPYLRVDCNTKDADLTSNESKDFYYFNPSLNRTCKNAFDLNCAIIHKNTWWEKWA